MLTIIFNRLSADFKGKLNFGKKYWFRSMGLTALNLAVG